MRSRVLLPGAATAVLLVAGCGSSAPATKTVKPKIVSASVIAQAANRAAAAPGYAFQFSGKVSGQSVGGTSTLSGTASTDAKQTRGSINVKVTPPGGLAALGPIQVKLVLAGGKVYIQIPQTLAQALPGGVNSQWLSAPLSGLASQANVNVTGLTSASPSEAFKALAKASTGTAKDYGQETVNGQTTTHYSEPIKAGTGSGTADVWIGGGLPRQIRLTLASSNGLSIQATLTFTSFSAQSAPAVPANAGSLSAVISQALKSGL